jgi:succinate dehydrogenase / fumarate reductase iron-sulfur subunit
MRIKLKVWRQKDAKSDGRLVDYVVENVSPDMSFLEMMDTLNNQLVKKGEEPVAFDHDCREGICGSCSMVINGSPHGPQKGTTTCQLHMRKFRDGDEIFVEPFRARAFPILKDLVVNRSAFDRVMSAGGYASTKVGNAVDANSILIPKQSADRAMDAAQCIGCGACVAVCKNASAMLFVSAKVSQFALLPQGQPERYKRVARMVDQMDKEGFGHCTNTLACESVCPKDISVENIARMNRDLFTAVFKNRPERSAAGGDG